ncbi:MAG: hypothetical protein ACR2H1_05375 [Limisphaerales bacterium]
MENEPHPSESEEPGAPKKVPTLALVLAFVPALLFLVFLTFIRNEILIVLSKPVMFAVAAVSLICCVTSSAMLFSRRTKVAILGGIVLLILNTLIALFFGCTAIVSDMLK